MRAWREQARALARARVRLQAGGWACGRVHGARLRRRVGARGCLRTCAWVRGRMGAWVLTHVCVGAWVRGCVGAWVRGCVGAWVRGCVGAWARGRVGAWARGRVGAWARGCVCTRMLHHLPDICGYALIEPAREHWEGGLGALQNFPCSVLVGTDYEFICARCSRLYRFFD